MYMKMKGIDPRGTPILRQFVREEDVQWNYQLYMNDIEIVQLDWFRSDPYQDYFRYLDSMGGFWLHRWGDHAMRTIAVGCGFLKTRSLRWMSHTDIKTIADAAGHIRIYPVSVKKMWVGCLPNGGFVLERKHGRRRLKREKEGDREGSVFCSVPVGCWNQNGHDKYDKSRLLDTVCPVQLPIINNIVCSIMLGVWRNNRTALFSPLTSDCSDGVMAVMDGLRLALDQPQMRTLCHTSK